MKVAIASVEEFRDYHQLRAVLKGRGVTGIVTDGWKRGAYHARRYAKDHGLPIEELPADFDRFGRGARLVSNREMLKVADLVVVFWEGKGRVLRHLVQLARRQGLPLEEHQPGKGTG